jgi:hypothetical protein
MVLAGTLQHVVGDRRCLAGSLAEGSKAIGAACSNYNHLISEFSLSETNYPPLSACVTEIVQSASVRC